MTSVFLNVGFLYLPRPFPKGASAVIFRCADRDGTLFVTLNQRNDVPILLTYEI